MEACQQKTNVLNSAPETKLMAVTITHTIVAQRCAKAADL
jgi:hypothetical protein